MSSLDTSQSILSEYLECERELARAHAERDAAIERAARAEAEVAHLRNALWLERHGERSTVQPPIDITARASETYVPPNTTSGQRGG